MKLLDRYIARTVLAAIGLVTVLLAGLQVFMLFVSELHDIGKGSYGLAQTAMFVLLQMPYQVYLFFPMAALLGCLIGLGTLANHSELVVMRAAGMSIGQVTWAVLKASLVVIVLVTILSETLVPRCARIANDYKTQAISGGQVLRTAHGEWLHYQHDFIAMGTIMPNHQVLDVEQFRFDAQHHLRVARHIKRLEWLQGVWHAYGVTETRFHDKRTEVLHQDEMLWDVALKPSVVSAHRIDPDEMSLHELHQYLRDQKINQQTAHDYQLAYFQRLIQPISTLVMMMLAIPFIFGPLRSSTMGAKLLAGAAMGFGFQLLDRFLGPVSQLFQFHSALAAFGPTFIFILLGLYLGARAN